MTALITIRREGFTITCDRGCYGAKHQRCDCQVCGGLNHGAGLLLAIKRTRDHAAEWTEAAGPDAEVELDDALFQPPLFLIGDRMFVALTDRAGIEVTVRPSPDFADTFALLAVGGATAKLDDDQIRQIRDGLTDWLTEIGADQ